MSKKKNSAYPLFAISTSNYNTWLQKQPASVKQWLKTSDFNNDVGAFSLIPGKDGKLEYVLAIIADEPDIWSLAHLAATLPAHSYKLESSFSKELATQFMLGWELACYEFTRYKKSDRRFAKLIAPKNIDTAYVKSLASSIGWGRDLINTPANDMHPEALAEEAVGWAQAAKGKVKIIKGEQLLKQNYPMIYTVGKASTIAPHLVDIRFPKNNAPKVTLVGKGVCFDSGGLDIKPGSSMKMMKKDMGGAASVLALAKMIVDTKLPVQLRVLLPIVENAIAGNAMRPSDVVPTRKGITVEIGNTDAEGRLILCDALTEADDDKPDLLIDCATLTGAARVALGTDVPVYFTDDNKLAAQLQKCSETMNDPMWRLPLWKPYRSKLDSQIADISNDPSSGYGGAITAALYLAEFVSKTAAWIHVDMMAWNLADQPGRPKGGDAMAVRALYTLIKERYGN